MPHPLILTTLLLIASNVFMTFAWYGHLKNFSQSPWYIAALISWGIALFEYLLQVPANRIGYTALNLGQLKILDGLPLRSTMSDGRGVFYFSDVG